MTLNTKDWKKLQQPIFLLALVLLLVSIFIVNAYAFCQTQSQNVEAQQLKLQAIRTNFHASEAEKNDILTFLPKYEALIQQGFIGEERRHTWIEALNDVQKKHHLFEIKYELGPLEAINPNYFTSIAPFSLHQSNMQLHFDVLHEGDLLTLTEALAEKELSPWLLNTCELTSKNISTPLARLHVECELSWLTLAEPSAIQGGM